MEWVSVKDRLPIQQPEGWPTYDWVLITSMHEESPITIARWNGNEWEFYYTEGNIGAGPWNGDCNSCINIDEITHWMPLPKKPQSSPAL